MRPFAIGLCLAATAAAPGFAQDGGTHPRNLAAACFTCHGTDGRSVGGIPPSLSDKSKDYLLTQLRDFKSGKRPATIMHQQAKGYTDQELEAIAGYFASIGAKPAPGY